MLLESAICGILISLTETENRNSLTLLLVLKFRSLTIYEHSVQAFFPLG